MTQLGEKERVRLTGPAGRRRHPVEWMTGTIGIIAAGVGAFLYFADPSATINILGWTSRVDAISPGWGYALQAGGGLLLSGSLAILSRRAWMRVGRGRFAVWMGILAATAVLAYALTFAYLYAGWLT